MSSLASSLLLFGALGLDPREAVMEQRVDLVEVNHVHDESGKHIFDQLIFYEWCSRYCRHQVLAWRLIKTPSQLPVRDWKRREYVCSWDDNGVLRNVRAAAFRESWTQHDPELEERAMLPLSERRELLLPGGSAAR